MRVLALVDGEKWTGAAAVACDQVAALVACGFEAQFGFVADSPLSRRLLPIGWARPLLRRAREPVGYLSEVRFLRETVRREKFDVVHVHRSYDHSLAAIALRGTGARLARTLHHVRYARRDPFSRALFRRTDGVAYANREIAERFGRAGPVLSPVVDAARFRPAPDPRELRELRHRLGLPFDRFLVGTVGKMSRGRGHEEALLALGRLPERVALVHVGHGEHQPELKRRAETLGVGGRNFWLGYQEEILPDLYRSWDAFLLPASGSDQGQRAILEALASGIPVIALDVPGVRDLMEDGVEGAVVARPEDFPAAVERLIGCDEQHRRLGRAAREKALAFTAEKFAPKAIAFYESLVSRSR